MIMKKATGIFSAVLFIAGLFSLPAFAQTERPESRKLDSEYVEKEKGAERDDEGGLFDFLPFVDSGRKKIQPENLRPSPKPKRSRPLFSKEAMEELQLTARVWLLTSGYTEPTVREDGDGGYYRDYIVFADEYEAEVVRGDAESSPFIGYIYIKGDYFKTKSHPNADAAKADFKFKYQQRDFRVVFHRVEQWEYSDNPNEEPFTFIERWEFQNLQSRFAVDFSADDKPAEPTTPEEELPSPESESANSQ
jgi:hypothetical protein